MKTIETSRLLFRPLDARDQEIYCACYTDPELMQLIGEPLDRHAAMSSFKAAMKMNTAFPVRRRDWIIQEKESGLDAGMVTLVCDRELPEARTGQLGVILFPDFQGKGYSTEATDAAGDCSFGQTSLETLFVHHTRQNIAVARVTQRLGYLRMGSGDEDEADWHWQLTRRRWLDLRAKAAENDDNRDDVPIM